jgi:hypothetical protein
LVVNVAGGRREMAVVDARPGALRRRHLADRILGGLAATLAAFACTRDDHMANGKILRAILMAQHAIRQTMTYKQLTLEYKRLTGMYIHWREWGIPLGVIATRDFRRDPTRPALTTLVVRSDTRIPGGGLAGVHPNPPTSKAGWKAEIRRCFAAAY